MSKILRTLMYIVLLGTCIVAVSSCDKDDDPANSGFGTITGVVTDELGQPIPDVTVTVSGISEEDLSATTAADGSYTVENVSLRPHAVTFAKKDWLTISVTVTPDEFDANKVATANASMVMAIAKITGTIIDARNGDVPLEGVTVSVGAAGTVKSGSDGTYVIENLVVDDYTITFTKENYTTITREVSADDFVDDIASLDIIMGGEFLLRGLTASDLEEADKWYYNEYYGGNQGGRLDWSVAYMSTLDFRGAWQQQGEGTTLQIRNTGDEQKNPADLDVFDSFVFGSKYITEDNKIMSVRMRTHNADAAAPAHWGVQVVDLSAPEPKAVKIADMTYGSENYADVDVDLSAYVGKEVVIAIGIYRAATGDYWKQVVLSAIRFAHQKVTGTGVTATGWLPGTEVFPGLSLETVRSTMLQPKKSFTGISPVGGNSGSYVNGYRSWREVNHVAREWTLVPFKKDTEPFAGQGYVIKTRNTPDVSTMVPDAYLYAKFAIAPGSNQLTFTTRNFSANPTYFKLTAIEDDGTVTPVEPQSNTAASASADADGCWKFSHQAGEANDLAGYAKFVYDLSQFNGKNVTLVIGVYNGVANSGENKLVFRAIDLN